jgi:CRP/FNR family transcriptional regulator, cyclic AMP receptor protein
MEWDSRKEERMGANTTQPAGLSQVVLFTALSTEERRGLAACLQRRQYVKRQIIFVKGDPGTSLYLIETGRVKIVLTSEEGKERVLSILGPHDFFGELALLDGEPRSADAVAQEACQLWLLQRADFLRYLETQPQVATKLLAVLSRRLRQTNQVVEEAAFLDVPARLARRLLELAGDQGQPGAGGSVIATHLTQTELAGMIGATRESVNKWLSYYEHQGLIHCQRGQIMVLRPQGLREYSL